MSASLACYICTMPIGRFDVVNHHHVIYKSQGGTQTAPTHKECHVRLHSSRNDFAEWGRIGGQISSLDKHWAFTLRGVKDSPLYEQARAFNRAMYAQ